MTTTDVEPVIAPGPILRSVTLGDIRAAALAYLKTSVTSEVTPVEAEVPEAMSPDEAGVFTVEVRNAGEPNGVRLVDVRHHLTAEPAGMVLFEAPAPPPVARLTNDANAPSLPPGAWVADEIFIFPADSTLEVGDSDNVVSLRLKALRLGRVTIHCHVHAKPDPDYLFPRDSNGENENNVSITFNVV